MCRDNRRHEVETQTRLETSCTRTAGDLGDACGAERCRTAGEGHGHTTRVHLSAESDSGYYL